VRLTFVNDGSSAAVVHVYDRHRLDRVPRRFTIAPGASLADSWEAGPYDLWILGPGGFHRHLAGPAPGEDPIAVAHRRGEELTLTVFNPGLAARAVAVTANAYGKAFASWNVTVPPGRTVSHAWPTRASGGWYDLSATTAGAGAGPWLRRFAGRLETGRPSISDPAMGGLAVMDQLRLA
jgi:phospholipase C